MRTLQSTLRTRPNIPQPIKGPTRLRLPFCQNGHRFHASDLPPNHTPTDSQPEWMALYDFPSMDDLNSETYLRLRGPPAKSPRETATMKRITVDRRLYDHISTRSVDKYDSDKKMEDVGFSGGRVMVAVAATLKPGEDAEKEFGRWYDDEHVALLSKVPGWLRTRRFKTSGIDTQAVEAGKVEYLALHEYEAENGLGGPEFKTATTTQWTQKIKDEVLASPLRRRVWSLAYTFGPAPRDLTGVGSKEAQAFEAKDGINDHVTKTIPGPRPAIESYVKVSDGTILPYRLEGSTEPDAPLLVLSNSILVDWGIWNTFVSDLLSRAENGKFRVLRYQTRGRHQKSGTGDVDIDLLAADIISILDALRVPRAAALIGVSLGGVTVLNAALKYPTRVGAFVACDTNAFAPPTNAKAWGERIEVAEKQGVKADGSGEAVVGDELAEMTVRRWFVKESYDGGEMEREVERVKRMVEMNSLEGFKNCVRALFGYDVREEMKSASVKGAFVAGSGDGVLPKTMQDMANGYGQGAEFKVIKGAGHLPMVEKPKEVADFVTKFLN
ncbi:hypothetical protein LTS18_014632 [Coniosporium uncinatum]|uniref:Uncharacterized protein n=1 Tax=Coniosporium uncinatum TaxID=93489 RepID=A0ACC3D8M3_9PEZI|nr:hypothetical protein LTS18_014632 [Coniosporium uncinatum]